MLTIKKLLELLIDSPFFYTEVAQNYSGFRIYAFCVTLEPQNLSVCLLLPRQPCSQARTQEWTMFRKCCLILHLSTQGFMIKRKSHNPLHIESRCGAQLLLHLLKPWFPASKHLLSLTAPHLLKCCPSAFATPGTFKALFLTICPHVCWKDLGMWVYWYGLSFERQTPETAVVGIQFSDSDFDSLYLFWQWLRLG